MKRKHEDHKSNAVTVSSTAKKQRKKSIPFFYAKKPKTLNVIEALDLDISVLAKL